MIQIAGLTVSAMHYIHDLDKKGNLSSVIMAMILWLQKWPTTALDASEDTTAMGVTAQLQQIAFDQYQPKWPYS